jgi:REP element-mobilizing transposase RayT
MSQDYRFFYRRNLPHFVPKGATLFVTFRLVGSIPVHVLAELHEESKRLMLQIQEMEDGAARREALDREGRRFFGRYDAVLDSAAEDSPQWLNQPDIAQIMAKSMLYWDMKRFSLLVYCIMSNHVHVVFTPLRVDDENVALEKIMQGLKGYSAHKANKILKRKGQFWHHESYDHFARDQDELRRIVKYVLNNPVVAGLVDEWQDWPWSYYNEDAWPE